MTGIADSLASDPPTSILLAVAATAKPQIVQDAQFLLQHLTHQRCHSKCRKLKLWAKLQNLVVNDADLCHVAPYEMHDLANGISLFKHLGGPVISGCP